MSSLLDEALRLHRAGLDVLPVHRVGGTMRTCGCTRGNACRSQGKHPIRSSWQSLPRLSENEVRDTWDVANTPNLGIRTGPELLVVDIDGEAGMAWVMAMVDKHGAGWGDTLRARTGSGGLHLYFRPTREHGNTAGRIAPGVDTRGVGGFVVAPPSVSARGVYTWEHDAPIASVPTWLEELLPDRDPPAAVPEVVAAQAPPPRADLDERTRRYLQAALDAELARLDQMRRLATPTGAGYAGEPWDAGCFAVSCSVLEVSHAGLCPIDEAWRAFSSRAPFDRGFDAADHERIWASALRKVGGSARAIPEATGGYSAQILAHDWADDDPLRPHTLPLKGEPPLPGTAQGGARTANESAPTSKPKRKRRTSGDDDDRNPVLELVDLVRDLFTLGLTPDGDAFAVPKSGAPLPVVLGENGEGLVGAVRVALLRQDRTVNKETILAALATVVALARAEVRETTALHLRVARHGDTVVVDLGQPGSAACAVVDASGWRVHERPPDGVLFRRTGATHALPTPVHGGDLTPLRDLLGLSAEDPRWHLAAGWLVASVLPDVQRPLLMLVGAAGTGKTSRALFLVSMLDPREELGSSFGRNVDDDRASALGRYLIGYDNLGTVSDAVSDHVCRLVTGEQAEKRRLYSDTGTVTMTYRRTGVVTAVGLPLIKADALERLIVLRLEPMPAAQRRSERKMRALFREAHPALLGALLTEVSGMLGRLPAVVDADAPGPRMYDYHQALTAWSPVAAAAYVDAGQDVLADAAEGDPFVVTVRSWLRSEGGSWSGEPGAAYAAASLKRQLSTAGGWWPGSPSAFTKAVTAADGPLRAVGIVAASGKSNGRRRVQFELSESTS